MTLIVDSDLNGASPQFTLTCISTGGPATTVTWTRDSVPVTEGTETVLDDPVTAQYTHTLNVTGRQAGLYTCTVANCKPSEASAELHVPLSTTLEDCKTKTTYRTISFQSHNYTDSYFQLLLSGMATCSELVVSKQPNI